MFYNLIYLESPAKVYRFTICLICFTFVAITGFSQITTGSWKTRIIKDFDLSAIPAPPVKDDAGKELLLLKEKIARNNEQNIHQIKYWDAGAPTYRWNHLATSLISFDDFLTFTRVPGAWMNLAIYDATILAMHLKDKYQRPRPAETDPSIKTVVKAPPTSSYPCEHSATAAAAAKVLAYFYPKKADSILKLAKVAAQSRIDAGLQFPSDVQAGWKLGEEIATKIIEEAKKDGSDKKWTGTIKKDPGHWTGEYPVGIGTASFRPIILKSGNQFRPPAPPDFAKDMKELNEFKPDPRSAHLAYHWASLSGLDFWTEMASQKIFEYRLQDNALACSQIYTVLNVAFHDAAIAIMDAKYAYWGIRPFQLDKAFKPLIPTPPFPGYPSGHAAASSAACTVLEYFFPSDATLFQSKARECADSRFYAGIHFTTDNMTGLEMGKKLGLYVIETWMTKK